MFLLNQTYWESRMQRDLSRDISHRKYTAKTGLLMLYYYIHLIGMRLEFTLILTSYTKKIFYGTFGFGVAYLGHFDTLGETQQGVSLYMF